MYDKNKMSLVFLAFVLLFTSVSFGLVGSGNEGNSGFKKKQTAEEKMIDLADQKGEEFGKIRATSDFSQGLKADAGRHFKTKKDVLTFFNLNETGSFDTSVFYHQFKLSFDSAYTTTYITLVVDNKPYNEVEWYRLAKKFAEIDAKAAGADDHVGQRRPNAALAMQRIQSDEKFNSRFSLNMYDENVSREFLKYYSAEFKRAYAESYLNSIDTYNTLNTNYVPVDARGALLELVMTSPKVISSNFSDESKPKVSFLLNPGTIKRPAMMAIRAKQFEDKQPEYYYTKLTEIYEVGLQMTTFSVRFFEKPELHFDGLNVEGAGIYEYALGKWQYLYTDFAEDSCFFLLAAKLIRQFPITCPHLVVLIDHQNS